jgi:hypothetical protein
MDWTRLSARCALFLLLTTLFQWRVWPLLPVAGDEPDYLISVISAGKDGDFDLANNFKNQDFRAYGLDMQSPQTAPLASGYQPPAHGIWFAALLALPYAFLGLTFTRLLLLGISVSAAFLIASICDHMGYDWRTSTLAGLLLLASPSWQIHATRVLPECTAGTLAVLCLWLLVKKQSTFRIVLLGALLGFMPVFYIKYSVICATLTVFALWHKEIRRCRAFYVAFAGVALVGKACMVWVYGLHLLAGSGPEGLSAFSFSGAFDRFWRAWFDRGHGILPMQIWLLLLLISLPVILTGSRVFRWAAAAILVYGMLLGSFIGHPGESMSGRFLCAILPLASMLMASWTWALPLLCCIGIFQLLTSAYLGVWPWITTPWMSLFPNYWPSASFSTPALPLATDAGPLGIAVLVTALAFWLYSRFEPVATVASGQQDSAAGPKGQGSLPNGTEGPSIPLPQQRMFSWALSLTLVVSIALPYMHPVGVSQAVTQTVSQAPTSTPGPEAAARGAAPEIGVPPMDLARARATASHGSTTAMRAIDGNLASRWDSAAPQKPGMWFRLDLGRVAMVSGVVLDTRNSPGDFPRGLSLLGSADGKTYLRLAASKLPSAAALSVYQFPETRLRFLKLVHDGPEAPRNYWSIHEISVFGR